MRSRAVTFATLVGAVAAVGAVAIAQPPSTNPSAPRPLPPEVVSPAPAVAPKSGVIPASAVKKSAPFDRYRNYESLNELTRQLVFSTQRGMEWLGRDGVHLPNGRLIPGVNIALGRGTEEDNQFRQANGAFALARAAKLTGEEKYAVRASETILSLLAEAPKDATGARKPVHPSITSSRVASAAMLAIAIYELPEAQKPLLQAADELCEFIKVNLKADGSVQFAEPGDVVDAEMAAQSPGMALAAISMSQRFTPAKWKSDAIARGNAFYRKQFRESPHPMAVPGMCMAFAEAHLQTRDASYAEFVFEMVDWLKKLQYDATDARRTGWRGGFPGVVDGKLVQSPPGIETALYSMAFADACRMIRGSERPDTTRFDSYRLALTRALQFSTTLQFAEENTQHLAAHFRPYVVGAFHPTVIDGSIRTDHTSWAVLTLAQYLISCTD